MLGPIYQVQMPDIVIPTGTADSQIMNWGSDFFDSWVVTLMSDPALEAQAYTIMVSVDGVTFFTLQDTTAAAVKVPAAGFSITYPSNILGGYGFWKIHAAGNVGGNRTIKCYKTFYI